MLLDGGHQLETLERALEEGFVERLHGMEAHDLRRDSLFPKLMGRLDDLGQHVSGRQQADILAVGYRNGLADLEVLDSTRMYHRLALFSHPDIDRPVLFRRR